MSASDRFVERIRLHERAARRSPRVLSVRSFFAGTAVSVVIGRATRVRDRIVSLDDGRSLTWDRLVLALGSRPDLQVPGATEHAFALDEAGAEAIAARLPFAKRVLVIGGGLTGLEAASEIAESHPGARVTLLSRRAVGEGFSSEARGHTVRVLERLGVAMLPNTGVARIERDHVITSDESLPIGFDLCIWAGGFRASPLPEGLVTATAPTGQVLVDPFMRSVSDTSIYVAGDLAAQASPAAIPIPMGCKSAGPGGALVADNIFAELRGRAPTPFDFVAPLYCVSLGRRDGFIERTSGGVLTGRPAAFVKELVCRFSVIGFALERWGLASYGIFQRGNVPSLTSALES